MALAQDEKGAFRCAIAPENSAAKLKVGGKQYDVSVLDTSRSGFTISLPSKQANRLDGKKALELRFRDEQWEVAKQSAYNESPAVTHVGLHRVRDLTKIEEPSSWGFTLLPKFASNTDPFFLLYLMVAFLVACICLPGVGDSLGTAPKVRKGIHSVLDSVRDTIK